MYVRTPLGEERRRAVKPAAAFNAVPSSERLLAVARAAPYSAGSSAADGDANDCTVDSGRGRANGDVHGPIRALRDAARQRQLTGSEVVDVCRIGEGDTHDVTRC